MTSEADSTADMALLPEGAGPARLIVCEQTGSWAVALGRELGPRFRISQTRSLAGCWTALRETPASFVIVELTRANFNDLIQRICRLQRDFPLVRMAVVADRSLAECEWLLREAGAVHFITSPRRAGELAATARRHLEMAPQPRRSLVQEVWARLPWEVSTGKERASDGPE